MSITGQQLERMNADADVRAAALDQSEFDACALHSYESLRVYGYSFVRLSPGDMTMYQIAIVHPITPAQWLLWEHAAAQPGPPPPHPSTGSFHVAHNFGPMYPWDGQIIGDWGYVYDKWTMRRPLPSPDGWTARILMRFLNTLAAKMTESTP